jgi:hypothetical protein
MIYDDTEAMLWNHNYQILTCNRAINSFYILVEGEKRSRGEKIDRSKFLAMIPDGGKRSERWILPNWPIHIFKVIFVDWWCLKAITSSELIGARVSVGTRWNFHHRVPKDHEKIFGDSRTNLLMFINFYLGRDRVFLSSHMLPAGKKIFLFYL